MSMKDPNKSTGWGGIILLVTVHEPVWLKLKICALENPARVQICTAPPRASS